MPIDFLTSDQKASYGQFPGEPNKVQLARYFHLDEADLAFINNRRGNQNRSGVALQLGCVRFLGTFFSDLSQVPVNAQWFVARQLSLTDVAILSTYAQRETTRREHVALIRHQYSESNPRAEYLTVSVCAVLLAEACNIGLEPLIKHQVPALAYWMNWPAVVSISTKSSSTLNRGEGRHAVARAICHGQRGEIQKRYREGLVTNALVLWNTIYMQAILDHLRQQGEDVAENALGQSSIGSP